MIAFTEKQVKIIDTLKVARGRTLIGIANSLGIIGKNAEDEIKEDVTFLRNIGYIRKERINGKSVFKLTF